MIGDLCVGHRGPTSVLGAQIAAQDLPVAGQVLNMMDDPRHRIGGWSAPELGTTGMVGGSKTICAAGRCSMA